MMSEAFDAMVEAFQVGGVRFLVAGGLAVNAHGYLRLTKDIDLVIKLDGANIAAAFRNLYRFPRTRATTSGTWRDRSTR